MPYWSENNGNNTITMTLPTTLYPLPFYYSSPEIRIKCNNDKEKFKITNKLVNYFKKKYDCNCIDGVRVHFNDGWGLVRSSNTQPILVCRFESNTKNGLIRNKRIIMNKIKEYLEL